MKSYLVLEQYKSKSLYFLIEQIFIFQEGTPCPIRQGLDLWNPQIDV